MRPRWIRQTVSAIEQKIDLRERRASDERVTVTCGCLVNNVMSLSSHTGDRIHWPRNGFSCCSLRKSPSFSKRELTAWLTDQQRVGIDDAGWFFFSPWGPNLWWSDNRFLGSILHTVRNLLLFFTEISLCSFNLTQIFWKCSSSSIHAKLISSELRTPRHLIRAEEELSRMCSATLLPLLRFAFIHRTCRRCQGNACSCRCKRPACQSFTDKEPILASKAITLKQVLVCLPLRADQPPWLSIVSLFTSHVSLRC